MPVFRLDKDEIQFPPTYLAEDDGLLAVGGDLSPKRLVMAYSNGIFPWYNEGQPIMWWCPKERFVIIPREIHISRSMKKFMAGCSLSVTFNQSFGDVMHSCRQLRQHTGTWITDDMEAAYNKMHGLGLAESCEVWQGELLVGGLYGVSLGRCFYGESMFSKVENASKLALIHLANNLRQKNFEFIDCQFHTDHLASMGGKYISYEQYMQMTKRGLS